MLSLSLALNVAAIVLAVVAVLQRRARTRDDLRVQALKLHVELLRQGAADPELAKLWVTERLEGLSDGEIRAHLFLNARVTVLELQWETGGLTPGHLREAAESLLATPEGRRYWERGREVRAKVAERATKHAFHQAFEAAYRSRYGAAPVAG
ncbi:hypothetical protein OK074_5116 [Actinobacteria bacterium OK074]|nr:hypothetical protein OK074_5116 [Actinobacteria bacterium OK074]